MAGAETILSKILDDARADVEATLSEAQGRAKAVRERSNAGIEAARESAMQGAKREAGQRRERRLRMAMLDARKEELTMKRELIDEVFSAALAKLLGTGAEQKRALFMSMLLSSSQGGETVLPAAADASIFTPDFVKAINERLAKEGKAAVTLGGVAKNISGGFVLSLGGMECNCSLEALLRQERDALETEVARALFPAKEG